jgi:5-methylcytosine-specific restriction enzyme A
MPDYLLYWKYFWQDMEDHPESFNDTWHTRNKSFHNEVEQGDSLWVVVSGGLSHPEEWRLLQRIVVDKKFVDYSSERPYGILGDPKRGQKFDVESQSDLTNLLHKLKFESDKRITTTGRAIGNAIQAIRPLSESDTILLRKYSETLERHWLARNVPKKANTMRDPPDLSGKHLNELWSVGAKHALYREDGKWYHNLKEFPGALFDANGYVIFETEKNYLESPYLQIQQDLHVINGISAMPNYIRITENNHLQPISQSIKKVMERKSGYRAGKSSSKTKTMPSGQEEVRRSVVLSERIIRDTKVGAWVKLAHEYQCQICGISLQLDSGQFYAEAHHIKPLGNGHNGPDVVENVICVCPNHHVLLDYGAIIIDKSILHLVEGHEVNDEYIEYHNTVIFKKVG